jgi:hypothetical protein
MATIAKFSIIKYGKNSELSQLTERDALEAMLRSCHQSKT